jgi:hypothetical protein
MHLKPCYSLRVFFFCWLHLWRPTFNLRPVILEFVVEKVTLCHFNFLLVLLPYTLSVIPTILHLFLHYWCISLATHSVVKLHASRKPKVNTCTYLFSKTAYLGRCSEKDIKSQTHIQPGTPINELNVHDKMLAGVNVVFNITSHIPPYELLALVYLCILWVWFAIEMPELHDMKKEKNKNTDNLSARRLSTVNCCRTPPCSAPHHYSALSRERPGHLTM